MSVTSQIDGSTLTIMVSGRFDFSVHQEFRVAYESQNPKPESYIVDLSGTSYLDSSALGMLLLLRDYAEGNGGDICITNCNDDVKKILSISNFEQLFKIS